MLNPNKFFLNSLWFKVLVYVLAGAADASAAEFSRPNTEKASNPPMAADAVVPKVQLPPGFTCSVFAAEPDVCQPIAMTTDARGRLWVAENYTYSEGTLPATTELHDRILIFEDSDNDGRFDRRTVFWDGAQRLTSIEVGVGGIWALCLPNLVFVPDENGDDIPDGPPQVVLDGFDVVKARHTMANGLRWGPDGWLYGRQGILGTSQVGQPGSAQRTSINVGIWRYDPVRKVFEVVAEGTTNPWGMDWDERGEPFFINTVIGHLWHVIPGAHYRRMFGDDPTPGVYEVIEQSADHVHWATSEVWTDVRKSVTGATLAAGGGHAHTGLLIYQGGQWPSAWNGKLLTINLHGRRLNVERLEQEGSGFVGRREPDEFMFPDAWFRGIDLIPAPDGGVFVSDWSDTGECHDVDFIHRTSGRIYKLAHGETRSSVPADLTKLAPRELAELQLSPNDWQARQARRVLVAQAERKQDVSAAHVRLREILHERRETKFRLRALWALKVSGGIALPEFLPLLEDADEWVRVWAVRFLLQDNASSLSDAHLRALQDRARVDSSQVVRLALAAGLPRLPVAKRSEFAAPLLGRAEDARDRNLPLILWYGLAPVADSGDVAFERVIASARIPKVQRFAARRLTEMLDHSPQRLAGFLRSIVEAGSIESRQAALHGVSEALSGRRQAPKPPGWEAIATAMSQGADESLRTRLRDLNALFGDGRALDQIRAVALDTNADLPQRRAALEALVEASAPGLREICVQLLKIRGLSPIAAAGLGQSDDPEVAFLLLKEWPHLYGDERARVMSVLVSRPAWAGRMLKEMEAGLLQRDSLSTYQARQIEEYHNANLSDLLSRAWGRVAREASHDREPIMAAWLKKLSPEYLAGADKAKGRAVFTSNCAACHTLNGTGGALGPDLTGSARDNLNYLLDNILFPSAVVPDAYRLTILTLKDGRVLAGMIRARTPQTIKLQSMTEMTALSVSDVAKEETMPLSLMPPGLLESMDADQARNLIAYLMAK